MGQRYVEVDFEEFAHETDAAALFIIDNAEVWIPWSQIEDGQNLVKGQQDGRVSITQWIAEQKGLEFD